MIGGLDTKISGEMAGAAIAAIGNRPFIMRSEGIHMGVFLQYALFPGRDEKAARRAVDAVVRNPNFEIRPERCRFSGSKKGTQVHLDGELEFAPLARALSQAIAAPVMLLYLYDGDGWKMTDLPPSWDFCGPLERWKRRYQRNRRSLP